jgi:uncharacterized protein
LSTPEARDATRERRLSRSLELALFATAMTWVIAASMIATRAARGLSIRFALGDAFVLLDALFLVFLLAVGFSLLESIRARDTSFRTTLGLPVRPTASLEWSSGAAIGWAAIALALVPMALAGTLHVRFWTEPRAFWLLGLNLAAAAVIALASELAFRGYPYRRLIEAIGPSWATIVMALVYGLAGSLMGAPGQQSHAAVVASILFGLLLCSAWLRTHGLWLGWGLHFAWIASLGILFGMPVNGLENLSSVVQSRAIGADWLTGGDAGPESALGTLLLVIVAIFVLIRTTRDWAWDYTHEPIIAAGYPLDVAPPAAHTAMEQQAVAAPPALVQILPTTPRSRSDSDIDKP